MHLTKTLPPPQHIVVIYHIKDLTITLPLPLPLPLPSPQHAVVNSDGLKMARSVDPEGLRTMGVLTKVDIMDQVSPLLSSISFSFLLFLSIVTTLFPICHLSLPYADIPPFCPCHFSFLLCLFCSFVLIFVHICFSCLSPFSVNI
jgi:hypothetical protein